MIIVSGAENIFSLGRDGRIAFDKFGHHATKRFDSERKGGYIQQQNVLDVSRQHATLNSRTNRDDLVRIHSLMRLFAKELLDGFLNLGDPCRTTHQNHLVDLLRMQLGVGQGLFNRPLNALNQTINQLLEFGARNCSLQVLGTGRISRDKWQVNVSRLQRTQLLLRLFACFLQSLQSHLVLPQVNALFTLELACNVID